ncbi:pilus assembly protein [Pendulispora brunnea]|uniref:Pilus assembly protein n=1 Tax=Pendulispora brunnea TaxID=2905690 RepID=A0ABZ2K1I9_9BACT
MKASSKKTARRIRNRGAAMVEAAVIMPVLISFFGFLTFFYAGYSAKQEAMAASRNGAFSQALQGGCGGGQAFPIKPDVGGGQGVGEVAGKSPLDGMVSQGIFTTSGSASKKATNAGLSVLAWSKDVTANSYVFCSPATGADFLMEALKAGLNALKGAVGL